MREPSMQGENTLRAGTRLSVLHRTVFRYDSPVSLSSNTLHLEPRTFPYQKTLSSIVRVIPATRLRKFHDLFDNVTHTFDIQEPHTRLEIESRIRVHNLPLDIPPHSRDAEKDELRANDVRERVWPYLQETRRVPSHVELWRRAVDSTRDYPAIYAKAIAIMGWIHGNFTYSPGSTHAQTPLIDAFWMKRGVCQDFTHIMLAMCRAVGLPARYASGYLYNGPSDSLIGDQASHAWCEVYLPGAGWIGFDPTNNNLADDRYVKVAVGRDYDDVAPVAGSYMGTAHCKLEVKVLVEKL